MKSRNLVLALLASASTLGCADQAPTALARQSVDLDILVPELRSVVDRDGRFQLRGEPSGEISAATAKALAGAHLKHAIPQVIGGWIADRGADIDVTALSICDRVFYATSPYEPLDARVDLPVRMAFSSRWLVGACLPDGTQVGSISVASQATHLVVKDGNILPGNLSNVFTTSGVPLDIQNIPVWPEEAASRTASLTGARLKTVPELVLGDPFENAAQLARWRSTIERPVSLELENSKSTEFLDDVYFGFGSTWHSKTLMAARGGAGGTRTFGYESPGGVRREVTLTIRPGYSQNYTSGRVVDKR